MTDKKKDDQKETVKPGSISSAENSIGAGQTDGDAAQQGNAQSDAAHADEPRDLKHIGPEDTFRIVAKSSSKREGWTNTTRAMTVPGGALVQVTSKRKGAATALALAFVPAVRVVAPAGDGTVSLV